MKLSTLLSESIAEDLHDRYMQIKGNNFQALDQLCKDAIEKVEELELELRRLK